MLPICTEEQFVGEGALRRAMVLLEEAYRLADEHADDVLLVRTKSELDDALTSGRIALILALEGAEPIGSGLELIDTFYRSGVRMASLSWNRRTMMADGVGESDTGGGSPRSASQPSPSWRSGGWWSTSHTYRGRGSTTSLTSLRSHSSHRTPPAPPSSPIRATSTTISSW
ncbi:membrane dipeptidase [Microbacterium oxydans]|nr:membrane dipeptidase [Microbacterium oxydans]